MSKIEKLSILGVRSFDHKKAMSIEFHAPLTLIVGMNGSGKTTIIECLKYATTGTMPPGSKGAAFIHDPAMAGEKEVMAQIKISYTSTEQVKMVCTRNLQLTVTKTKPAGTFKTLDATIVMRKGGERNVISSRVAEIDTMMPRFLGVSRAVLESVIFCHQEESLWPMSSPKDLKEKFDQIFEALKYTKAIDNIKILQKNKKVELVTLKANEDIAKVNNDKAIKLQKKLVALTAQSDAMRQEVDQYGTEQREAQRMAQEFFKKVGENELIVGKLRGKRIEKETKEESVRSLRENIVEMSDSDDELETMLQQYDERVDVYQNDLSSKKDHYHDLEGQVQSARDRRIAKERECGSYEAQKESHDRQVESRQLLIKNTARAHDIRGYDFEIDDAQARAFIERITAMARDQQAEFEQARLELQDSLQQQQQELNQINERKSALGQTKATARQTITGYERKISSIQSQRNQIDVDEGARAALESRLQEKKSQLVKSQEALAAAAWDAKIENDGSELRKLEDVREKLDVESADASRRGGETAQLDLLKKEVREYQRSLDTMTSSHGDKLGSMLGKTWSPDTIEREYERALKTANSELEEAKKQRDGTNGELGFLNSKLVERKAELATATDDLKAAEKAIKLATGGRPQGYLAEVKQLETVRDDAKSATETFGQIVKYLQTCIDEGEKANACKTCCRAFKNRAEVNKMIEQVQRQQQAHDGGDDAKEDLEAAEEALELAKGANSKYEEWERLSVKDIPSKKADVAKLEQEREKLVSQLEELDVIFADKSSNKSSVINLERTVRNIQKYVSGIAEKQSAIENLESKMQSVGALRSIEDVQDDVKKNSEEQKSIRTRIADATRQQSKAVANVNALQLEISNTQGSLSKADYELKEKKSLDTQEEEYKKLTADQRESIKKSDDELHSLSAKLATAQAKYDDISRTGTEKDRDLQEKSTKLNTSVNKLRMAEQEIKSYHERGGDEQLRRAKRAVEDLKAEEARYHEEQLEVMREVKKVEGQLSNHAETRRSISDNQRYRRDVRQLKEVVEEIAELEASKAEEDKTANEKQAARWQLRMNEIAAKQASVVGQLKTLSNQIEADIEEYKIDYKDAASTLKKAHVYVETTKAAIEDLGRYSSALDKAIMQYHSMKMELINRIIEELWRKTYQGTDIDTIMIRSEHETVKANKTYNYRVCMVKQDAELDMRGRCSAGQKVLASIIIRMALAECFGVNCGLIALDEPTTNLDSANIRALATSLSEIIKMRRSQRNFQLIIITHDEEFLTQMGSSDYTDDYFRVFRDEHQLSRIEKQSISEVL
jgi:DNA repair protein RAD50